MKSCLEHAVVGLLILSAFLPLSAGAETRISASGWQPKELWKGFNLQGMFIYGGGVNAEGNKIDYGGCFREEHFRKMREWGFNFARLPLDYRYLMDESGAFKEDGFRKLDEAIEFGRKWNVHVQPCLHRAPGFCVIDNPAKRDLFKGNERKIELFLRLWREIARRYKGVPNERVSFNPVNEPGLDDEARVVDVYRRVIEAVHKVDSNRFIVLDGRGWGRLPLEPLEGLPLVGFSARGYDPVNVTHYLLGNGGSCSAYPTWPIPMGSPCGSWYPGTALNVSNVPACTVSMGFGTVTKGPAHFEVVADGRRLHEFSLPEGLFTNRVEFAVPDRARLLTVRAVEVPDRVYPGSVRFQSADGQSSELAIAMGWENGECLGWSAMKRTDCAFPGWGFKPEPGAGVRYLRENVLAPWRRCREKGTFVMVGEWGVSFRTPHAIACDFVEDMVRACEEEGLGWAMWTLDGDFGIANSGRTDARLVRDGVFDVDLEMLRAAQGLRRKFGRLSDGRETHVWRLEGKDGLVAEVSDYGGRLVRCLVPSKNGTHVDVALGWNSAAEYERYGCCMGTLIGRYGNRIGDGRFQLDGKHYQLEVNENRYGRHSNLHGGPNGWDRRLWDVRPFDEGEIRGVELRLTSPDGDQGFPGTVEMIVRYRVHPGNVLSLEYEATTDKATVINPTHHGYWNLAGEGRSTLDLELEIFADEYTKVDAALLPIGNRPVAGTDFDFTSPRRLSGLIDRTRRNPELTPAGSWYDHNFVLRGRPGEMRRAATVRDSRSGLKMEVWTTEPGLQVYGSQAMNGSLPGKAEGVRYPKYAGLALETQHFPDSPNHPEFPSTVLRPGETFHSVTEFRFGY